MIKGEELRLGNLVLDKENKISIVTLLCGDGSEFKQAEPIKLTEQMLFKVGFRSYSNDILVLEKRFYYIKSNHNFMIGQERTIKCEYLHQLQNLYFALTGQELNTNKLL